MLVAGSVLAANADENMAVSRLRNIGAISLQNISVLDQVDAQTAMMLADSALQDLDGIRAGLGAVQNQLYSTIANLTSTRINIGSAESTIRDLDFADESIVFSKLKILKQTGSFAAVQANASSQLLLNLVG